MSEKRPNVFPKQTQPEDKIITAPLANVKVVETSSEYEEKKLAVANEAYNPEYERIGYDNSALELMRKRTEEQLKARNEQIAKNLADTQNYQEMMENAKNRPIEIKAVPEVKERKIVNTPPRAIIQEISKPEPVVNHHDDYVYQLSQPQYNMSFDLIPLPSEGKIYRSKKANVKVAYLTTSDENILTSPNLLQSGEFLEILINRKLLERDLRYRDLHVGDRNAIMLWIRATGYGEMYPVTLYDENNEPFETEINLNNLKVKKLGAEPDSEGYFDFILPVSKTAIKFRLLTVGDVEDIDAMVKADEEAGIPINNTGTYALQRQLVHVGSERNKAYVKDFIEVMRVGDGKALRAYIDSIESGVELDIEVGTPGGGSIKTFLPLNFKFFWPDLSI